MVVVYRVLIGLLVALCVIGCSDKQQNDVIVSAEKKAESNFVISVNGKCLTRAMINERVGMMLALRKIGTTISEKDEKQLKKTLTATYPSVFVDRILREAYARSVGVQVSDAILESCRTRAVRNFRSLKVKDWAGLLKKVGNGARYFEELVEGEALNQAIAEHLEKLNPLVLPNDYAEAEIQKLKDYNARMDATNAVVHARATNVWEQIKGGLSFRLAAAKYSTLKQERKDKGKWAKLDWPQIEGDPELVAWARKLKPGEFSPPIEGDNGLMILMVDAKDDKECELSRIYFSLPMFATIPTPEQVIEEAKKKHLQKLLKETYKEIRSTATIVKGNQKVPTLKPKVDPRNFKKLKTKGEK